MQSNIMSQNRAGNWHQGQDRHLHASLPSHRGDYAHLWWANQWRILLAALANTLLEAIRRLTFKATALARTNVEAIRLKLIKVGAVIVRKKSVIRIHLISPGVPEKQ